MAAVLFTDESELTLYTPDGSNRVWRRTGEHFAETCLSPGVPFDGGGVMIWARISFTANRELRRVRGVIITADSYIRQYIEEHVISFVPFVGENFRLI